MIEKTKLRMQAKQEARARMLEKMPMCMLAVLIYALPVMALGVITTPGEGASLEQTALLMIGAIAAEILLIGPLTFGLMHFFLFRSRGGTEGLSVLFAPYASLQSIWRSIRMLLCLMARGVLWMLIPAAIYVAGIYLTVPYFDLSTQEGFLSYYSTVTTIFVIICLPFYSKILSYQIGYMPLIEDENLGAWRATKISASWFRGRVADLLLLVMSFIPWFLFGVLSYGVGMLVAVPYFLTSLFRMTDLLRLQAQPPADTPL